MIFPYDNGTITFSVNTPEECTYKYAKEYIRITGVKELVAIHEINSNTGCVDSEAISALVHFCKSMGNKPIIFEFGPGISESETKIIQRYREDSSARYRELLNAKQFEAILEYAGFSRVEGVNGDAYTFSYVYNNEAGHELRYRAMAWDAGIWIGSNVRDSGIRRAFIDSFPDADRKEFLANELIYAIPVEKRKQFVAKLGKKILKSNNGVKSVEGF